jgi:hypothetical protein
MGTYETTALADEDYHATVRVDDSDDLIQLITTAHEHTVRTVWTLEEVLALIADLSGAVGVALDNRASS